MSFPDFDSPFVVHCDASEKGLGAVLCQKQEGQLKVISYASRSLSQAEKNYHLHSGKLEFLALKWAVTEKFSDYLLYGPPFEIYTDNNPLTYVMTSAKLNAAGLRWVAELANYQFSIKYRSGVKNKDADFLSRNPIDQLKQRQLDSNNNIDSDDISIMCNSIVNCTKPNYTSFDINILQLPPESNIDKISKDTLAEYQQNDSNIAPIYNAVRSNLWFPKANPS